MKDTNTTWEGQFEQEFCEGNTLHGVTGLRPDQSVGNLRHFIRQAIQQAVTTREDEIVKAIEGLVPQGFQTINNTTIFYQKALQDVLGLITTPHTEGE